MRDWLWIWGIIFCLEQSVRAEAIDIGIVQRFGETQQETLIQTVGQQPLMIQMGAETLTAKTISIRATPQPLSTPVPWSRVVVSFHRSFEDAEVVAQNLAQFQIPTEIARPERWQVWAARKSSAPTADQEQLVRQLQGAGYRTARVESGIQSAQVVLDLLLDGKKPYQTTAVAIQAPQKQIKVGKRVYAGMISLKPNAYGTYSLINRLDLETYLRGVVPYEIAPGAPFEAIKAQAVVARTFALKNKHRFDLDGYDLCATANCQVYKGLGGITKNTDQAVISTKGQVLTYKGQLVDALYTSANGGQTARYSDLWGGIDRPYLPSFLDRRQPLNLSGLGQEQQVRKLLGQKQGFNEAGSPAFRWQRTYTSDRLAASLNKNLASLGHKRDALKTVREVQVAQRSSSGRVLSLAFTTDQGEFTLSKDAILSAIEGLPSTLFYLEPSAEGFRFVGGGWGHGLGLSQYGSYGLARQGLKYPQILQFYFPQTNLQKVG